MSEDKKLNEVIRVQKRKNNFVMMDKTFLEDERLSYKAKGILAYLLSKPDNWKVIVGNLINYSTDGKGSIYKGLNELKEKGYYDKTPVRNDKGVIIRWDSVVFEIPNAENIENTGVYPLPKNQEMDYQEVENLFMENRERNNNDFNKDLDFSNNHVSLSVKTDGQDTDEKSIQLYTDYIKNGISYDDLVMAHEEDIKLVDEIILIMLDVFMTDTKTVRIDSENKPKSLVINVMMKLTYEDIEHVIWQFKDVTERITKKRQYLLTMLYNSKMERNSHNSNLYESNKHK